MANVLCHALAYEFFAIVICAPLFAWIMHAPLELMGALTISTSVVAMLWNMVFNAGYDRLLQHFQWQKTAAMRLAHGVAFEGGLAILAVPLAMWWLGIGWWQAFWLDAGILLFLLPYTVIFNWLYDHLRALWLARRK